MYRHIYTYTYTHVQTHTYTNAIQTHTYTHIPVLKGIIGYPDYSFKIVIFKSFKTNQIFVSF